MENVNLDHTIEINNIQKGHAENLSYDYLVICTGGSYDSFLKDNACVLMEDRIKYVREMQTKVAEAEKIMVVGGGAAGLEMVGELRHAFPEKPIGLVHRGKTLLPYYTKSA